MIIRAGRRSRATWAGLACITLAVILATPARSEEQNDLASLVAKVDPSVVTITLDNQSLGSGFIVGPSGLVATNYHVIEGAKWATVAFSDKRTASVDGFLAIDPTKDLALLHIGNAMRQPDSKNRSGTVNDPWQSPNGMRSPTSGDPGMQSGKDLSALRLSDVPAAKGDRVFAFGSPMGLSGSVSDGIVACIRPGREVSQTLLKLTHRDVYCTSLGYDLDAQWIQTTAPISPGNSGGPLVNARGEVVGINTWVCAAGQNLNFSLSVVHLRQFLVEAGKIVQPLTSLPPPRPNREVAGRGDPQKSLAFWIQLNRFGNRLSDAVAPLEKKFQQIVPIDPRHMAKGEASRNRRKSVVFEQLGKAFSDFAGNVKSADSSQVDPEIVALSVAEADIAQRMGDAYHQLSIAAITQSGHDEFWADVKLGRLKDTAENFRTVRDVLRIKLSDRYDKHFPSIEETAKNPESNADVAQVSHPGQPADADATESSEASGSGDKEKQAVMRVWTDRTGLHQTQAKYLGMESGKVKLEKPDGAVIRVPISTLSEADQRFLGLTP